MQYIYYLSTFILIVSTSSCNQDKGNEAKNAEIKIAIDSVVVDSKREIIDTKYGLNTFGFDSEKKVMYKFNTNNRHGLEVIDMNKMELIDFVPFEIEGPNGTTTRVTDVHYISDDKVALTVYQAILIFNMKGELQEKFPISQEAFEGDSIPKDFGMESSGLYVPKEKFPSI